MKKKAGSTVGDRQDREPCDRVTNPARLRRAGHGLRPSLRD